MHSYMGWTMWTDLKSRPADYPAQACYIFSPGANRVLHTLHCIKAAKVSHDFPFLMMVNSISGIKKTNFRRHNAHTYLPSISENTF
jgi:hypothetical protein